MEEDEIAALDGDWLQFTPSERAAFAWARKLTYELHALHDMDVERLRQHYTDLQILEMTLSVAGNNAINRWKEGIGVPQSSTGGGFGRRDGTAQLPEQATPHSYLTPTSAPFRNKITQVAPLHYDAQTGLPTRMAVLGRRALEPWDAVVQRLDACRHRTPRLPLASEEASRAVLPGDWTSEPLPLWVRLLAHFPRAGVSRIVAQRDAEEKGDLPPRLKAQVSWIIARQDGAWYATGESYARLKHLGCSDDQIRQLDGSWTEFSARERALFQLARDLAASPIVLADEAVAEALRHASPREVVQLISYTTLRASFHRITEAAGLPCEP